MVIAAIADKQLQAHTMLFDTWYAAADNRTLVHCLGRVCSTTITHNRRVSLSKEAGSSGLCDIDAERHIFVIVLVAGNLNAVL